MMLITTGIFLDTSHTVTEDFTRVGRGGEGFSATRLLYC